QCRAGEAENEECRAWSAQEIAQAPRRAVGQGDRGVGNGAAAARRQGRRGIIEGDGEPPGIDECAGEGIAAREVEDRLAQAMLEGRFWCEKTNGARGDGDVVAGGGAPLRLVAVEEPFRR